MALLFLVVLPAAGQAPPRAPFTLKMIGPGVYAAISDESNAGFVIGDDAVLVVDSFFEPDTAKALLGEIRKLTPKPVRYVVNTHYHIDHVSGDQVFKDAGAIIIAHRNVRAWIRPENVRMMSRAPAALQARAAQLPLPDLGTENPITVWLGARRIDILCPQMPGDRPRAGHQHRGNPHPADAGAGVPEN